MDNVIVFAQVDQAPQRHPFASDEADLLAHDRRMERVDRFLKGLIAALDPASRQEAAPDERAAGRAT